MSRLLYSLLKGTGFVLDSIQNSKFSKYYVDYKLDIINNALRGDFIIDKINILPEFKLENQDETVQDVIEFYRTCTFLDIRKIYLLSAVLVDENPKYVREIIQKIAKYIDTKIKEDPLKYLSSEVLAKNPDYERRLDDLYKFISFNISYAVAISLDATIILFPKTVLTYLDTPQIKELNHKKILDNCYFMFVYSALSLEGSQEYFQIEEYLRSHVSIESREQLNINLNQILNKESFNSIAIKALQNNNDKVQDIENLINKFNSFSLTYVSTKDFCEVLESVIKIRILSIARISLSELDEYYNIICNDFNKNNWFQRIYCLTLVFNTMEIPVEMFIKRIEFISDEIIK